MAWLVRSEEMVLMQILLKDDIVFCCVAEMGELGLAHFRDINVDHNHFNRKYTKEIQRCESMERILRFVERNIWRDGIVIESVQEHVPTPDPQYMMKVEAELETLERNLTSVSEEKHTMKGLYLELSEMRLVLKEADNFLQDGTWSGCQELKNSFSVASARDFGFITGTIQRDKVLPFERMLWRVSRGNMYLRCTELKDFIQDPQTREHLNLNVFFLFYAGEHLRQKIQQICEGFHTHLYQCPESRKERQEMAEIISMQLENVFAAISNMETEWQKMLQEAAFELRSWDIMVKKRKAVYHVLNCCDFNMVPGFIVAEFWCQGCKTEQIQRALHKICSDYLFEPVMTQLQTKLNPPTCNITNKFTLGFQNIVDAYGVASYQEINPTPYTIITFPFLFAVMFGDCGHAIVMFIFSLWIISNEKKIMSRKGCEIWNMLLAGRYLIFLMSVFSIYTGLIYNECFSKALNIYGSSWSVRPMILSSLWNKSDLENNKILQLDPIIPRVFSGNPYPFGIDPIWSIATNKISFLNSYKMKMSVILGVIHMVFGVTLSLFNHIHFRSPTDIITQLIPKMLFILCLFGYLAFMIIYKWCAYDAFSSQQAPSILIHFINMFLFNYKNTKNAPLYPHQKEVQSVLVVIAGITVPWMLLVKPFLLRLHQKNAESKETQDLPLNTFGNLKKETEITAQMEWQKSLITEVSCIVLGGEFDFGDICVHQVIHTIEYCLGCISNTASYLRLWALSLAHEQLSEVLWRMVIHSAFSGHTLGFIILFITFTVFANLTLWILLVMEAISAFLHTLRLHWVEFQNKFYQGTGYKFSPFSFHHLLGEVSVITTDV